MMRIFPALLVVAFLAVPLRSRTAKEPFTLAIRSEAQSFKAGSPVEIKLSLTNNSASDLDASANISDLTGVDPNFVLDVSDAAGNPVSKRPYEHPELATGHAILSRIVKPGKTLEETADLSRVYDLSRPGDYDIQASRRASETKNPSAVESNTIKITITP
jgi:hypothetical protein